MADNKRNSEGKNRAFLIKSAPSALVTRAQADQLQKELDHLALLLNEVKRQAEKVEAVADAIGDALVSQLYAIEQRKGRPKAQAGTKTDSRRVLRSFPDAIRPQGLERAQG